MVKRKVFLARKNAGTARMEAMCTIITIITELAIVDDQVSRDNLPLLL